MKLDFTPKFKKNLKKFPQETRAKFYKQAQFLIQNLRHPSLHAKKYDETLGVWQGRVDKGVRFYFLIEKDIYVLLDVKFHD